MSGFSFDPKDPTLGVPIERDELRIQLGSCLDRIQDPETSPNDRFIHAASIASGLIIQTQMGPDRDAGETDLELERRVAAMAELARSSVVDSLPEDAPRGAVIRLLRQFTATPLNDKRKAEEQAEKNQDRLTTIRELQEEAKWFEAQFFDYGSKQLRKLTYEVERKPRNARELARDVANIKDNGSEVSIFNENESKLLAGISLSIREDQKVEDQIQLVFEDTHRIKAALRRLHANLDHRGLYSALVVLQELFETENPQLTRDASLRPLLQLAEHLFGKEAPDHTVTDTLIEGPFKNCTVIEKSPWSPERGRTSTVIIDDDLVTSENILDDITKAATNSNGTHQERDIEQKRIDDFIELRKLLITRYGATNIRTLRTLRSRWHPLPWYAVEITDGDSTKVVMESPIYGNASYVIRENDWLEVICYRRTEAKQLYKGRVKAIDHKYDEGVLRHHVDKLDKELK